MITNGLSEAISVTFQVGENSIILQLNNISCGNKCLKESFERSHKVIIYPGKSEIFMALYATNVLLQNFLILLIVISCVCDIILFNN